MIALCELKEDAELIASALNAKEDSLRRLAIGFIDAGERKLADRWKKTVELNKLSEADAKSLWDKILEALRI